MNAIHNATPIAGASMVRTSASTHPVTRARIQSAMVLTTVAFLMSIALVGGAGALGMLIVAISMPLPLVLIWCSVNMLRADEV